MNCYICDAWAWYIEFYEESMMLHEMEILREICHVIVTSLC
jgi:hypothetical protein